MNAAATVLQTGESHEHESAPVVFVPGFGHAEAGLDIFRRHLDRAGFHDVSVVEYRSTDDIPKRAERLAHHVRAILACTGAERLHVVGHSIGGVVARYYVQVLGGSSQVASVTSIGAPHAGSQLLPPELGPAAAQLRPGSAVLRMIAQSTTPTDVHWINYACDHDLFADPLETGILDDPRLDAVNIHVEEYGHLSVALPGSVSRSVAEQLAALEGLPGFGNPVAALPGSAARLSTESPPPVGTPSTAGGGHASAKPVHRSKLLRLVEPAGV